MSSIRCANRGQEFARRLRVLPPSLEIYLTNRCNLRCSYCSSKDIVEDDARSLTADQVERGVEWFASWVGPEAARAAGGDPAPRRTVGLTGGEPLLDVPLLMECVRRIRRRWPWLGIDVVTNGTLLTPRIAGTLLDQGVNLGVSLDGVRGATDRHRRFRGPGGRGHAPSVFDAVAANLRRLSLARRGRICALTTYTAETISSIVEGIGFLRALGLGGIVLDLDMYETWDEPGLRTLRESLRRLGRYYAAQAALTRWPHRSGRMFGFSFENKHGAARLFPPSSSLALTTEGVFLPCDALGTEDSVRLGCTVGSLSDGIDLDALEKLYLRMDRLLARAGCLDPVLPPMERYYEALARGKDPARALANGRRVDSVFGEELGAFIRVERVFSRLGRDKSFGDFDHEPPRRAEHELPKLRLALKGSAGGEAAAREAVDCLLYSEGVDKELSLEGARTHAEFEVVEAVAAYAVLKARRLGKRVRVEALSRADGLPGGLLDLLRDFGVFFKVLDPESATRPAVARLIKGLGAERVGAVLDLRPSGETPVRRLARVARQGIERVRLRFAAGPRWGSRGLERLVRGLAGARGGARLDRATGEPCGSVLAAFGSRFVLTREDWALGREAPVWAGPDDNPVLCPHCRPERTRGLYGAGERLACAALRRALENTGGLACGGRMPERAFSEAVFLR